MNASEVKRLRTQSALKEVIGEALAALDDGLLRQLCVTDVECKKGRFDAFVWLDKAAFDEGERRYILTHLRRAAPRLELHVAASEGWARSPHLHFAFDERLDEQNRIDALFARAAQELEAARAKGDGGADDGDLTNNGERGE